MNWCVIKEGSVFHTQRRNIPTLQFFVSSYGSCTWL